MTRTKMVLSYDPWADLAVGTIGEGPSILVPVSDSLDLFLARDGDLGVLNAFQIHRFTEEPASTIEESLLALGGPEIARDVLLLHESVSSAWRSEGPSIDPVQFMDRVAADRISIVSKIPGPTDAVRQARVSAARDFLGDLLTDAQGQNAGADSMITLAVRAVDGFVERVLEATHSPQPLLLAAAGGPNQSATVLEEFRWDENAGHVGSLQFLAEDREIRVRLETDEFRGWQVHLSWSIPTETASLLTPDQAHDFDPSTSLLKATLRIDVDGIATTRLGRLKRGKRGHLKPGETIASLSVDLEAPSTSG